MDSITHTLAGLTIAKAGFRQRLGKYATAALGISAVFPDIDFIFSFWGPFVSLKMHRGFTHSFPGIIVTSLLLAGIFRLGFRVRNFWAFFGICLIGNLVHVFFDLMTSFGTQLFYPFSTQRYSLDWLFLLDGVVTASLLAPLIIMKGRPHRALPAARIGLAVLALYLTMAAINHHVALQRFKASLQQRGISYAQVAVLPRPFGPFRFSGLAQQEGVIYRAQLSLFSSQVTDWQKFASSIPNRYVLAARNLEEVKFYRWFARFPLETYTASGSQHVVEYMDLRFRLGGRNSFILRVVMNGKGQVLRIEF